MPEWVFEAIFVWVICATWIVAAAVARRARRIERTLLELDRRVAEMEAAFWEPEPPEPAEDKPRRNAANVVALGRKAS